MIKLQIELADDVSGEIQFKAIGDKIQVRHRTSSGRSLEINQTYANESLNNGVLTKELEYSVTE